jgi:hypothetical protein
LSRRVAGVAAAAVGIMSFSAPASASMVHSTLVPTPGSLLPRHGGTADSLNWAGYAVTGSGITAVDSVFKVPAAGAVPPGFSATWAGIGGYNTTDLIQAGVSEEDPVTSTVLGPQYNAWYEILPAAETPISGCSGDAACTVTPGDTVTVDIHNVGTNLWSVSLTDAGHWSWSQNISYASSESSAEWIQEAPSLGGVQTIPANVGTVNFGPTSTYTQGGATNPISAGNPTLINESAIGIVNEATTSALGANGESFNVCVYAQSCPAP